MKRPYFLIFILFAIFSCRSDNTESYEMSWMGWAFIIAVGIGIALFFVFEKRFIVEAVETSPKINENNAGDYKPIGNYIGGHPKFLKPVPGFVFRRNSHCCMSFYSNHSDNPPEFRFKIKAGSFRNISVENLSSVQNGNLSLPDKTLSTLRKKSKGQLALLKIEWTDGESMHSTFFSFEGNDARLKADSARENLLQALN